MNDYFECLMPPYGVDLKRPHAHARATCFFLAAALALVVCRSERISPVFAHGIVSRNE